MKKKGKIILILLLLILIGIYYYVTLPAINIHSSGFWVFLLFLALMLLGGYLLKHRMFSVSEIKSSLPAKLLAGLVVVIAGAYLLGSILSSPVVNADQYQKLITPQTRSFTEDIEQVNYNQIPLLDKDSAELLGNRKMGNMVDMVSQFEVSTIYSQINYQGDPVRVSPLEYADPIKWLTNQSAGIPAYIRIDMASQDTELVRLEQTIRYSESEYFNRNIYRHLRFRYPTYIFDQLSFEINDEGVPYWVCPVKKYNIGLFGGQTIGRVVLCNAQTGECTDVKIEDCPTWVDRAYPADLLIELYNYHGRLINGFFNSIFGQKGCLKTTDGYNYLAMDDDVWVYTGITSVSSDQSNVGFVLMNQRTMETRYYEVNGAEEYSAMASAEGQVQNLGYHAAFPLLLNISNEPTYLIALKDDAGLVKKYAMVNIQKYQIVAIGDTVSACEEEYIRLLNSSGISESETGEKETAKGRISRIAQSVIEGNSHFYIVLEGDEHIYDVPVVDFIEIVGYREGDYLELEYYSGDPVCTVVNIRS